MTPSPDHPPVQQPKASHFINGRYVEDSDGAALNSTYPATGEVIAELYSATPPIVDQALAAADTARAGWAAMTGSERGRILRRAAEIIRARNHELSVMETYDTGKPLQETLVADAASGADCLEYFGSIAAGLTGEHIQLGADFAYTIREPLGVCVGLGAWNYPTQIACWKAAPALACGNTMVFKPSETTPLGALKLAEILSEAGLPDGVFNVVQGYGDVGAALVEDKRVAKVSLTGSVPTGRKVYAAAAAGMKHVTMELGGKSPLIIFDDASLDDAISAAINGNFYSSGQICSNGTRVFVQKGILPHFLARLKTRTERAVIGDPMDEATNFGPMVSQGQLDITLRYIEKGVEEGATLITGGKAHERVGLYIEPTVFSDVTDDMAIAREEIFGPVMSVLPFDTEEEVMARANDTEFGLAAGVFTSDLTRAHRVVKGFEAGTCWINAYNLTPIEMPFGGVKASGVGRENAHAAIEHYSEVKSVYVGLSPVEAAF
ncbi:betaine-aldehyde dehydrogenase [uncultured Celeribacter sp.]|uniref:betaine-aldehyde dehydrogenase n=1 Tax=uncultured Celeribacter sp. TaxID=1303376 RepID=UPI002AA92A17|nr:betaine-aldehyde dehydrogenase [uncultured Celeribacter sp.]